MATTIKAVGEAFEHLFSALHDGDFRKSIRLTTLGERELLRHTRFFLLGWFGRDAIAPEYQVAHPWSASGFGQVDFLVDGVAVELAVRKRGQAAAPVSPSVNGSEMVKLVKHPGHAMLVLFDFARTPLTDDALAQYRGIPPLGRGNYAKSPFHLYYFNEVRGIRAVRDGSQQSQFAPHHMRVTP